MNVSNFDESEMLELKRRVLEKLEETTDMLKLEECMALLTGMEIPVWYSDGSGVVFGRGIPGRTA